MWHLIQFDWLCLVLQKWSLLAAKPKTPALPATHKVTISDLWIANIYTASSGPCDLSVNHLFDLQFNVQICSRVASNLRIAALWSSTAATWQSGRETILTARQCPSPSILRSTTRRKPSLNSTKLTDLIKSINFLRSPGHGPDLLKLAGMQSPLPPSSTTHFHGFAKIRMVWTTMWAQHPIFLSFWQWDLLAVLTTLMARVTSDYTSSVTRRFSIWTWAC